MIFTELLGGAFVIDPEPYEDARGSFSRIFCQAEFSAQGLSFSAVQSNLAQSHAQGTVRGLHYQTVPALESKLVRCTRGAVYDVIADLRPESPSYLQHVGVELSADNRRAVYVPELFAHGYQTLTPNAELIYQVSAPYSPVYERGVRYDDPALQIRWPLPVTTISEKDQHWPLLGELPRELLWSS